MSRRLGFSLRWVSKDEDEFKSGRLKGGCHLTLRIEGIRRPEKVVGRPLRLRIYEVDRKRFRSRTNEANRGDAGKLGNRRDLQAEYKLQIKMERPNPKGKFCFDAVERIWPETSETLPDPESHTHAGVAMLFKPEFVPPHFKLSFETQAGDGALGAATEAEVVLIKGDAGERENYVYELVVEVSFEDEKGHFYRSSEVSPKEIDCTNLLAHNCAEATKMLMDHHEDVAGRRNHEFAYPKVVYVDHEPQETTVREMRRVGMFYGSHYQASDAERHTFDELGVPTIDCVTYVLRASELGHDRTNAAEEWKWAKRIYDREQRRQQDRLTRELERARRAGREPRKVRGGGSGMHIVKRLVELGWLGLYINKDTKISYDRNHDRDGTSKRVKKSEWERVSRSRSYYGVRVVDAVVDYDPTTAYWTVFKKKHAGTVPSSQQTNKLTKKRELLEAIPFGIINFSVGLHTALWCRGKIYEVHWDAGPYPVGAPEQQRPLFEARTLEDYPWCSGIVCVPPGVWDKSKKTIRKE